jgi:hypothetical protein
VRFFVNVRNKQKIGGFLPLLEIVMSNKL